MDFAPYQSSPPEHSRVASPATSTPRPSLDASRRTFQPVSSPPPLQHPQPQRSWSAFPGQSSGWSVGGGGGGGGDGAGFGQTPAGQISDFDTSLGLRLDYEACLAYLLVPPLGPILLLILERNSDFVRFHAWQSALLFTVMMIIHILFSASRFLSWLFFLFDLVLIAFLTLRAYRDTEILDRYEVPFFGSIASRVVDDE